MPSYPLILNSTLGDPRCHIAEGPFPAGANEQPEGGPKHTQEGCRFSAEGQTTLVRVRGAGGVEDCFGRYTVALVGFISSCKGPRQRAPSGG